MRRACHSARQQPRSRPCIRAWRARVDEDHAHDLLGPALRVEPSLYAAQRVSHQYIRSRNGPGLERCVQVIHYLGEDLRPGRRIAETIAGSKAGGPFPAKGCMMSGLILSADCFGAE